MFSTFFVLVGSYFLHSCSEDTKTLQGSMVWMIGSIYKENRMLQGIISIPLLLFSHVLFHYFFLKDRRRNTPSFGNINSNSVANNCSHCRPNYYPMSTRTLSKTSRWSWGLLVLRMTLVLVSMIYVDCGLVRLTLILETKTARPDPIDMDKDSNFYFIFTSNFDVIFFF